MMDAIARSERVRGLLAGLIHGLLMYLAFPPIGLWGCALAAPLPLLLLLGPAVRHPGLVGLAAAVGTLPMWMFEHQWVMRVSGLGYWPLVAYCAGWTWAFIWIASGIGRRWRGARRLLWVVAVWTGLDYLRGSVIAGGYPWYFVSQPLIALPGVAEIASVVGQHGVTAMVVLMVVSLMMVAGGRDRRVGVRGVLGVSIAAGVLIWTGVLTGPSPTGKPVRIAVVQTNVPSDNKTGWTIPAQLRDFARISQLTREAAAANPDLIVWPETMLPGAPADPESVATARRHMIYRTYEDEAGVDRELGETFFADQVAVLQAEVDTPMLIGAMAADGLRFEHDGAKGLQVFSDGMFNSVLVVAGSRVQTKRYDKVHLTPFGETMPLISAWPWLEQRLLSLGAHGMRFDLSAGDQTRVLELELSGGVKVLVGTPICFESTVSRVCRALVRGRGGGGAELLINLTNDGWFGDSDRMREQHLLLARWRCAELGRPMVRAANTGLSAFIDARGNVIARGDDADAVGGAGARVEGILVAELTPAGGLTIFARLGDAAGLAGLIVSVLMWASVAVRKWKRGAARVETAFSSTAAP